MTMKFKLLSVLMGAAGIPTVHATDLPGNTLFARDLYQQLAGEDAQANLFFSPYSISTALAMTRAGAAWAATAARLARRRPRLTTA